MNFEIKLTTKQGDEFDISDKILGDPVVEYVLDRPLQGNQLKNAFCNLTIDNRDKFFNETLLRDSLPLTIEVFHISGNEAQFGLSNVGEETEVSNRTRIFYGRTNAENIEVKDAESKVMFTALGPLAQIATGGRTIQTVLKATNDYFRSIG